MKLSPTGQLQVIFSKQINTLPFRAKNTTDVEDKILIEDAIEIKILDWDPNDDTLDKSISSIEFIRQDKNSMTVQIVFTNPHNISPELLDPDYLRLVFLEPGFFIDKETLLKIKDTLTNTKIKI